MSSTDGTSFDGTSFDGDPAADRVELDPASLGRGIYPLLTASLIPRAIAWVSSVSRAGIDNLAPHSFTTVAGVDPPTLCFTSVGFKDTLANVRASGEFVLSIGSSDLLAAMNDSATDFPDDVSEFDAAGLTREASSVVRAPRVREAPIAFECRARGEHQIGNCVMVFGEVVHVAIRRAVLADDGLPDPRLVDPLARLGRAQWSLLGQVDSVERIRWQEWQDGRRTER